MTITTIFENKTAVLRYYSTGQSVRVFKKNRYSVFDIQTVDVVEKESLESLFYFYTSNNLVKSTNTGVVYEGLAHMETSGNSVGYPFRLRIATDFGGTNYEFKEKLSSGDDPSCWRTFLILPNTFEIPTGLDDAEPAPAGMSGH